MNASSVTTDKIPLCGHCRATLVPQIGQAERDRRRIAHVEIERQRTAQKARDTANLSRPPDPAEALNHLATDAAWGEKASLFLFLPSFSVKLSCLGGALLRRAQAENQLVLLKQNTIGCFHADHVAPILYGAVVFSAPVVQRYMPIACGIVVYRNRIGAIFFQCF